MGKDSSEYLGKANVEIAVAAAGGLVEREHQRGSSRVEGENVELPHAGTDAVGDDSIRLNGCRGWRSVRSIARKGMIGGRKKMTEFKKFQSRVYKWME